MALNLNELQQKLVRLIYNLEQMRQKAWKLFYSPTPENVEIKQYDEWGFVNIVLIGEDTLTSNIYIINKQVTINGGSIVTSKYTVEDNKTGIYCLALFNSYLQFNDVNITIPDLLPNETKTSAGFTGFVKLQRVGRVRFLYVDNVATDSLKYDEFSTTL